ncbi:hypothetical protein G6F57_013688 [Rhizopus arrhizus]|nr:hypothetical protein G6F57_013688 [Rhizopus arrhizus]
MVVPAAGRQLDSTLRGCRRRFRAPAGPGSSAPTGRDWSRCHRPASSRCPAGPSVRGSGAPAPTRCSASRPRRRWPNPAAIGSPPRCRCHRPGHPAKGPN